MRMQGSAKIQSSWCGDSRQARGSGPAMGEPASLGDAHFWIGCLAVVSGYTAFAAAKGRRTHRIAGKVFVISMLLLTASGLWLSIARGVLFTVFLSAIAFHAVATGWAAACLGRRLGGALTRTAPVLSGGIALGAVYGGMLAAAAPTGMLNGLPPGAFYLVAGVGGVVCVLDVLFAFANRPSQQRLITRHLWRMGFSFFLATGIFFFGNNHVLPAALRTPPLLSVPVLAVVLWTLVYAVRTRFASPP